MDHEQTVPGFDIAYLTEHCIPRVPQGDTLWSEPVSINQQQAERLERVLSQMQRDLLASSSEQLKSDGIAASSTPEGACIALGHADFSELERRVLTHMVTMGSPVRVVVLDENGVSDGVLDILSKGDRTYLSGWDIGGDTVSETFIRRPITEMAASLKKPRATDVRQHPQPSKFAGREWWRRSDKLPRGLRNSRGRNVSDESGRVPTKFQRSRDEHRTGQAGSSDDSFGNVCPSCGRVARPRHSGSDRRCKDCTFLETYGSRRRNLGEP